MMKRLSLVAVLAAGGLFALTVSVTAGAAGIRPPQNVAARPSGTGATISWSPSVGATSYVVTVYSEIDHGFRDGCTTTGLSCAVNQEVRNQPYLVFVRAAAGSTFSPKSKVLTIDPLSTPDCTFFGPAVNLSGCDLAHADLAGEALHGTDMVGADLYRADLAGANLNRTNLSGADLQGANLTEATLEWAQLPHANLTRALLDHTQLFRADMVDDNLTGADLNRTHAGWTDLDGANTTNAIIVQVRWAYTICPNGTVSGNVDGSTC